jgi:uncharacterized membrane protein (DUF485 family)
MSQDPASMPTRAAVYNARLGLVLFFLYLAVYATFVYLSAFHPQLMAEPALAGVNVAIVYGFGLIVGAFVLAILYMALCRDEGTEGQRDKG